MLYIEFNCKYAMPECRVLEYIEFVAYIVTTTAVAAAAEYIYGVHLCKMFV